MLWQQMGCGSRHFSLFLAYIYKKYIRFVFIIGSGYLDDGRALTNVICKIVEPIINIIRMMVMRIAAVIRTTKKIYNLV